MAGSYFREIFAENSLNRVHIYKAKNVLEVIPQGAYKPSYFGFCDCSALGR